MLPHLGEEGKEREGKWELGRCFQASNTPVSPQRARKQGCGKADLEDVGRESWDRINVSLFALLYLGPRLCWNGIGSILLCCHRRLSSSGKRQSRQRLGGCRYLTSGFQDLSFSCFWFTECAQLRIDAALQSSHEEPFPLL